MQRNWLTVCLLWGKKKNLLGFNSYEFGLPKMLTNHSLCLDCMGLENTSGVAGPINITKDGIAKLNKNHQMNSVSLC